MLPPYRAERVGLLARHGETAIKISPILPDTMHHHGELARNRHLSAAHADTSGQCLAPAAQAAVGNLARQDGIGGLIQIAAQQAVTTFGNMPASINIAGLVSPGCQAEISTDRAGMAKPFRCVDHRNIGQRDNDADCRNTHQLPRCRIGLRPLQKLLVKNFNLLTQNLSNNQHWFGNRV